MDRSVDIAGLLARISLGDRQALKTLYDAAAGRLLAVAMRILNDRGAAEDVVQEVFVSIWNKSSEAADPTQRSLAWLCVVTRNRALDAVRRRKPETPLHWTNDEGEEVFHDVAADNDSPLDHLQAEQASGQLGECLETLDPEPRLAIMLAYCEGLTHAELAERLKRPLGTIKAWTRRNLLRLRDCMEAAA
jgi:RNA polymerase sigma-70 factor, ECF subfamily